MQNSEIAIYIINLSILIIGFLLGSFRRKKDKTDVEHLLATASSQLNKNLFNILNDFYKNIEDLNRRNANLINTNNEQAIKALNNQVKQLNGFNETLSNINNSLKDQQALYERIAMLQKIIVKKKKKDLDK